MKTLWLWIVGIASVIIIASLFIFQNVAKPKPATPTPRAEKTKIKLLQSTGPITSLPVLTAEKQGFFVKHNLDVDAQPFVKGVDVALLSGQFDVSTVGLATYLAAAIKGGEVKLIGVIAKAEPFYIVSNTTKENIKQVAINRLGGENYYQTANSLRLMGINPSKVEYLLSGDDEGKYPMLLTGKVDAGGYPSEAILKVQEQFTGKIKIIHSLTDDPNAYYPQGITTRIDFLNKNPEALRQLLAAIKEGIDYARSHREESIALLMNDSDYKLTREQATAQYEFFLKATENLDMKPRIEFIKNLLVDMAKVVKEAADYDPNKFVDTTFAP